MFVCHLAPLSSTIPVVSDKAFSFVQNSHYNVFYSLFSFSFKGFAETGIVTTVDFLSRESRLYDFEYEYDINEDNINGLTLKKFSEQAEDEMWECGDNCPYQEYAKFIRYYERFDYADNWIQASFDGEATDLEHGNADFSEFEQPARAGELMSRFF